jgi:hypothetical protein
MKRQIERIMAESAGRARPANAPEKRPADAPCRWDFLSFLDLIPKIS